MTFRTRLLLVFTAAVVASVGLVEWLSSSGGNSIGGAKPLRAP